MMARRIRPLFAAAAKWVAIALTVVFVLLATAYLLGIRFNTSRSVPYGFYRIVDKPVARQVYVRFCPPATVPFRLARARGYIEAGSCPSGARGLIKTVVGVPGDYYRFSDDGLVLNGHLQTNTRPLREDGAGRSLPLNRSSGILQAGQYILMGNNVPNSYDARYYGIINEQDMTAVLEPVWLLD